jgi:hypothetical protein
MSDVDEMNYLLKRLGSDYEIDPLRSNEMEKVIVALTRAVADRFDTQQKIIDNLESILFKQFIDKQT